MKISSYMKENWLNWGFAILTIAIAITYVWLSRYALPKTDDFANLWKGMFYFHETGDASASALGAMIEGYLKQQGTFFSGFTATFLLLKVGTDLVRFRHIVMAFVVFFFVAMCFSLRILAKYFRFEPIWGLFLFSYIWIALDRIGPGESLMFITGIAVYGLPIALCFLSISFYALLMETDTKWMRLCYSILSAGCAFCSCGGVLMVAAMTNMLMVIFVIHRWYSQHRFPLRGIIPFFCAFVSALVNALAPGNFNRYSNAAGDAAARPHIKAAIWNTFGVANEQLLRMLTSTYLLIALALIALLVLFSRKEINDRDYRIHPFFFFIGSYALTYIVMFPSVLGYDMVPHGYIQERTVFTFSQAATLGIILTWTYLMFWIKTNYELTWASARNPLIAGLVLVVVCTFANLYYVPIARQDEAKPTLTEIYIEHRSGSLKQYYMANHLVFWGTTYTRKDSICRIEYEVPDSNLFAFHNLSSDTGWWVNYTIASIYEIPFFAYVPDHEFGEEDVAVYGIRSEDLLP